MKEFLNYVFYGVLTIVLLLLFGYATGYLNLDFKQRFGTKNANIDREIFKENKAFIDGKANDLSKYKLQFETSKDIQDKKAILNYIKSDFSDFNSRKLENQTLRIFLDDVMNGVYDIKE